MLINITPINKDIAISFIQLYHYSKIMPKLTKHYLGVFKDNEIIGVITLGWGTQPKQTLHKIFYNHKEILDTKDYFEIGKMCFIPKVNNSNIGSQIMSKLIKYCKNNLSIQFLYTLADGIMGKCGYIYQASNFIYIGKFKTSVYLDRITGEKIHPRSAKLLLEENAKYSNKEKVFWLEHNFCEYKNIDKINGLMFRYILPLSDKGDKILKSYNEYSNLKHPKDVDLKYERRVENGKFEEILKPDFNMDCFNHNYQKY